MATVVFAQQDELISPTRGSLCFGSSRHPSNLAHKRKIRRGASRVGPGRRATLHSASVPAVRFFKL
jgi:hypothetical protein